MESPVTMVVARMTRWKYKSGQREKALETLDEIMAIGMSGFRGDIILLAEEDPDTEVIVTFWDDDAAMKASAAQLFHPEGDLKGPLEQLQKYLTGPPEVTDFTVYAARARDVRPGAAPRPV
ncbi:antibiotic biosynthesis monooxygenase family protein [Methanoculleus frigidifontis]|uniref:antibiotic biosynthesis monooxygenase family protein n=1 Tax=Methanoculleus frigidifontis TaxID=2584085 RepID=UPI002657F97C|nr:antibiotic biosynthesis monooxygenase family protein [Methanoculleus sp. FWC-SCC1]